MKCELGMLQYVRACGGEVSLWFAVVCPGDEQRGSRV